MIIEAAHLGSTMGFYSNAAQRPSNVSPAIPIELKNLARRPSYFFLVGGDFIAYMNIAYGSVRISYSCFISTTFLHLLIPGILFKNRYRHGPRGT
jgi:hypothetical protein